MKLKLLTLSMLLAASLANAQYTVTDRGGNVLQDGDIIEYATTTFPEASYEYEVTNTGSQDIYMRIELVDAVNSTNGEFSELCFGECLNNILEGDAVPPAPGTLTIPVGQATLEGNHFYSADPGNGVDNVDFIFKFHQLEADGTTEIGTPLTFTYRYNPTLGVKNNNKVNLTIQSTIISSQMVVNVKEPVSMLIYNVQGQVVKKANLQVGNQQVDMSNLSAQAYIVQFKNEKGAVQATKIIVQ